MSRRKGCKRLSMREEDFKKTGYRYSVGWGNNRMMCDDKYEAKKWYDRYKKRKS